MLVFVSSPTRYASNINVNEIPQLLLLLSLLQLNRLLPVAVAIMKRNNVLDTRKVFGVMSFDAMSAGLAGAKVRRLESGSAHVPIIGGHSPNSTVPLYSQIRPHVEFTKEEQLELTDKVRKAYSEVVSVKEGRGTATLSMAHSVYHFVQKLLDAMHGVPGVVSCALVRSDITPARFFCNPLLLGVSLFVEINFETLILYLFCQSNGMEANLGIGPINDVEKELLAKAIVSLQEDCKVGEAWVEANVKE